MQNFFFSINNETVHRHVSSPAESQAPERLDDASLKETLMWFLVDLLTVLKIILMCYSGQKLIKHLCFHLLE